MNEAFATDWKAIGLDFPTAFHILSQPKATPRPPRTKKPSKTQRERVMASLQDPPSPSHFNTDIPSREESDRTISIRMGVL